MLQRALLFIPMILCPFGLALAGDWPQWRGPDRTGVSKETGLLPSWPPGGPKLLWTFRDAGIGYSSMSIVGNRLYSMGAEGKHIPHGRTVKDVKERRASGKDYVYAIDLNTRKKLWSVEVGPLFANNEAWDGPCSTPTIDGNFLYALDRLGNLVCVETASGKKVWSKDLVKDLGGSTSGDLEWDSYGYCESPLVDGDQVVVTPGGKKGAIAAFDKRTGMLKWRSTAFTDKAGYSSMIAIEAGGVRQYVQICFGDPGGVAGVRASDGKLLWRFDGAGQTATPIYWNDCVYTSQGYSGRIGDCHLLKLMREGDQFKAKLIYRNQEMGADHGGVILVGGYLYGCPCGGRLHDCICQDFKTGKRVWKKRHGMGNGSLTFADGNLYSYHENRGDMLLFKATPAGYQEQGRFRIPEGSKFRRGNAWVWTHPVVANGKLYLRDQELIFCYDVRKPH